MLIEHPADLFSLIVYAIVGVVAIALFRQSKQEHALARKRALENERLTANLQLAARRKDEFLALLAHELRNPLAPVRSGLDLLDRLGGDVPAQTRVRRTIRRQLDQLIRIVDDLFDVSRFLQGRVRLQCETLELSEIVSFAIESAQALADDQSHELQFVPPQIPMYVHGDRARLLQVIGNLLNNAIKYTPRCGRIRVFFDESEGVASVHVHDNGVGVPLDLQQRIFDHFTQADSSRTREHSGLGLGLAIVRQLTELHGGSVSVQSEGPGRGSRFTINLPLVKGPALSDPSVAKPATRADFNGISVLIVDDNVESAEMMGALLSFEGFAVSVVHDGAVALQSLGALIPRLVLLDIGLPGLDGYEVARRIRRTCGGISPKLVAVTGWGSEEDVRQSQLAGFDAHVVKPVDFDSLLSVVRDALSIPDPARKTRSPHTASV